MRPLSYGGFGEFRPIDVTGENGGGRVGHHRLDAYGRVESTNLPFDVRLETKRDFIDDKQAEGAILDQGEHVAMWVGGDDPQGEESPAQKL